MASVIKCVKSPEEKIGRSLKGMTDQEIDVLLRERQIYDKDVEKVAQLSYIKFKQLSEVIKLHPKGAIHGLTALISTDRFRAMPGVAFDNKLSALNNLIHSKLSDIMVEFRPKLFSFSKKKYRAQQYDFIRAIVGKKTDGIYSKWVKSYNEVFDILERRYSNATLDFEKYSGARLPTSHDPAKIGNVDEATWIKMAKEAFGLEGYNSKQLSQIYRSLKSEGYVDNPFGRPSFREGYDPEAMRTDIFNSLFQNKVFKIKDMDAWIRYHEKFSATSPYSMLMDHLSFMAKDIAMVEQFGPMPSKTFGDLANIAAKEGKGEPDIAKKAFNNLTGASHPANRRVAETHEAIRNMITGILLPKVILSVLPDIGFTTVISQANGVNALKVQMRFLENMFPKGAENLKMNQALAAKLGFNLDHLLDIARTAMRHEDTSFHIGSAKFADKILRGSGLIHWTASMKQAFHMGMMEELAKPELNPSIRANLVQHGFTDIEIEKLQKHTFKAADGGTYIDLDTHDDFTRRLIYKAKNGLMNSEDNEWIVKHGTAGIIRTLTKPEERARKRAIFRQGMKKEGYTDTEIDDFLELSDREFVAEFIKRNFYSTEDLKQIILDVRKNYLSENLKEKLVAFVHSETKYAVPEGDTLTRAILNQGSQRGTHGGELLRDATMFKSFMLSIIQKHGYRAYYGNGPGSMSRLEYTAKALVMTTSLGILSVALKEVAAGRSLPDITDEEVFPKLFVEGLLAGGATSIAGELLFEDFEGRNRDIAGILAGPAGSEFNALILNGLIGNFQDFVTGRKDVRDVAGEFGLGVAKRFPGQFPGVSLVLKQAFLDEWRKAADPSWQRKQRMRERKRMKEMKNERIFE